VGDLDGDGIVGKKKGALLGKPPPFAASNGWSYPGGKLLSWRQVFVLSVVSHWPQGGRAGIKIIYLLLLIQHIFFAKTDLSGMTRVELAGEVDDHWISPFKLR
jgi:hypothetical protein